VSQQRRTSEHEGRSDRGRRVRYVVATSLDGFIAGPNEEADWIVMDPDLDFEELSSQFDTMLMGRRTFEWIKASGGGGSTAGMDVFVFSRTLRPEQHPEVTVVEHAEEALVDIHSKPGKDVWLFGGGSLFGSLAKLGYVDTVEVAVMPVLLGEGVPLLRPRSRRVGLKLTRHKLYANTGIVLLEYAVQQSRDA
jgi:dihydrofolate reductase